MPKTPIETVKELQPLHRRLKVLGYKDAESFIAASRVAHDEMTNYLGVDVDKIVDTLPSNLRELRMRFAAPQKFSLGVRLERIPSAPAQAFKIPPPPPPPTIAAAGAAPTTVCNMIAQMPPIRDQGRRGTCVAHAVLAVVEHKATVAGRYADMSEQHLYYLCKQNDGDPNDEGTWIAVAMAVLNRDGCCTEVTWPYVSAVIPGNEGQGPPPASAAVEALTYREPNTFQIAGTAVHDLKSELLQGRCVAFDVPVFNSWYLNTGVTQSGDIVLPFPGERPVGGHAMCLVGFQDMPGEDEIGGGRFFLRNSWGTAWGTSSSLGIGYGTIPYSYLARYGQEAYSIS